MKLDSLLAVAVATECVGIVFWKDNNIADFAISRKAYSFANEAAQFMHDWISRYSPEIVVTERIPEQTRRGHRSIELTNLLAFIASFHKAYDISVLPDREGRTRFEQAAHLAEIYPNIAHRLPEKNKIWESEDRAMILFRALTLAHGVLSNPTVKLAENMDRL